MINQLWGNQDSTRFNQSQDNIRQQNNSINNSTNNITTREVPVAQQGDKLPQIESNNARPLMGLFRHMIPGFNNAYKQKQYQAAYQQKQRQKFLSNQHKLPFMEPAVKADMNTYNGGQLPGITVEAVDLSKPQRFPYGGINVESKSVRGSLDRKQRTYVNPFEGHNLVAKNQEGNKLPIAQDAKERYSGGERVIKSGKYYNDSISVRAVKSKSPWYKNPALILERIQHSNVDPMFNDTTYAEQPSRGFLIKGTIRAAGNDYYSGKKKRWQYPIFGDFFNFNNEKSTPEDKAEYDTLKRRFNTAWGVAKHQIGGLVERADNTLVASRPQLVKNEIPYRAGKGPAADSPMRLFNDPYINIGLMAMGPMVSRFSASKNINNYMNQTPKVPDNARVMGIGVRGLARRTGKSPQEVIKIMSQKFGSPQTYPKAFDNSEPAYGWTFENPDHYRQALQLFNLK